MGTVRKGYRLRGGDVWDILEYHDGKYGAKGKKRLPKKKPTKEDMLKVNAWHKARMTRLRMIQYFGPGDLWVDLTYKLKNRPPDMKTAVVQVGKMLRKVRREYKKQGRELFWIRNIELGTKGGWHIHLIINEIENSLSILQKAWEHGYVSAITIKNSDYYDEDFSRLSNYITKDQNTQERKKDGTPAKPRIKETSYSHSRNMPLPEPKKKKLVRWKKEIKPKKGYYMAAFYEGINPKTGYKYRRYTMIRLNRRI